MGAIFHESHSESVRLPGGGRPCFLGLGYSQNQVGGIDLLSLLSNAVVSAQILLLPFELFKTESESSFDALSHLGS